jgi:hypothetical protein
MNANINRYCMQTPRHSCITFGGDPVKNCREFTARQIVVGCLRLFQFTSSKSHSVRLVLSMESDYQVWLHHQRR